MAFIDSELLKIWLNEKIAVATKLEDAVAAMPENIVDRIGYMQTIFNYNYMLERVKEMEQQKVAETLKLEQGLGI
jgi:hypothetical protein